MRRGNSKCGRGGGEPARSGITPEQEGSYISISERSVVFGSSESASESRHRCPPCSRASAPASEQPNHDNATAGVSERALPRGILSEEWVHCTRRPAVLFISESSMVPRIGAHKRERAGAQRGPAEFTLPRSFQSAEDKKKRAVELLPASHEGEEGKVRRATYLLKSLKVYESSGRRV